MAQKRSDLGYLGETFQYRLTHEFMENHTFFEDLSSIIDQNMFTDPNLKTLVGVMKNYYEREGHVPSYDMLEVELRDISHSDKEIETYLAILEKVRNSASDGVERTRELAEKFFKQQNIIRTANEILKIAGNGDTNQYEACVDLLNDAMTKGAHNDFGEGLFDHINETLSDDYRVPIPTGIGKIDETLEGGLGKGELGVIIGPTSFGKCLSISELVMTPTGIRKVGDIKVGDYLIGSNGKKTKVLGVYPQPTKRPIYKVTFTDNTYYECDEEHILPVNTYFQRNGKKYDKTVHKKIYAPDFSFKNMTLREIIDSGLYRRGHRHNFATPICKAVEFEKKETCCDPYVLGVLIGDGCFTNHSFCAHDDDASIIDKVISLIPEDIGYSRRYNKPKLNEVRLFKPFWDSLSKDIDITCKSNDKYIPYNYLVNDIDGRIKLLQGLMDTDGFVMKSGYCCYNTKSEKLAKDVCFLVRSLGGLASIHSKEAKYFNEKYNEMRHCGVQYEISFGFFDEKIKVSTLERKQNRVKYLTNSKFHKFIDKVEYLREDDAVCFLVDADDHLFLTRDFNVTHNTSLTTAMASHAACNGYKVLQIVFEDRIKQIQRKHLGRITGIEAKDLSKPDVIDLVRQTIDAFPQKEKLEKNLRIVKFPSGEKTARQLERFIKKLINSGFKPDLTIIDYFECLEHELDKSSSNEFSQEGKTMRRFEAMAGELDMAIWIPSQGTKDSINLELVTMDKIGGSVKKAQIAHVIMSIARTVDDIANNKATIAILKNRAGKSGKVFNNVEFNNGTCRISTDNVDELDSLFELQQKKKDALFETQKEIAKSLAKKRN